jgi:hypothetical protein
MTRQISMATRKELIGAVAARYRGAPRDEKHKILDEFVALTGSHRKHAIRILSREPTGECLAVTRDRIYDEAVRQSLNMLWEAADRICGKRLKVMIPILIDDLASIRRTPGYAAMRPHSASIGATYPIDECKR